MATYIVGPTSAGLGDGSDYDNCFDPNDYEAVGAAGDLVYFSPGAYRLQWDIAASGVFGLPIVCIADVTGEHTDGVGGVVRITGSDDDQTATRTYGILCQNYDYRTFRGFHVDTTTSYNIKTDNADNIIIEDLVTQNGASGGLWIDGDSSNHTVRHWKSLLTQGNTGALLILDSVTRDDTGHVFENLDLMGGKGVTITRVGGLTFKNLAVYGGIEGLRVNVALTVGQTVTINNSNFYGCYTALRGTALGEIVEDYNNFWGNLTARNTVNTGGTSKAYPILLQPPTLLDGYRLAWQAGALSEWSELRAIAGTGEPTDDIHGMTRPTTSAKKSWGPYQYYEVERSTSDPYEGVADLYLTDAGRVQQQVGVPASSVTFTVRVRWGADYTGAKPQMVIKQPGQADRIVTAVGSSGVWEQLSDTFTPASDPEWVMVELVSNNGASSGDYVVEWDDFDAKVN